MVKYAEHTVVMTKDMKPCFLLSNESYPGYKLFCFGTILVEGAPNYQESSSNGVPTPKKIKAINQNITT